MLADPVVMSWFRPSFVNIDTEFPNPFFGIETEEDRELWPRLSPAGRCALRWRWSVRLAAQLHHSLAAAQLKTIRFEHLMGKPDEVLADLSRFTGTTVQAAEIRNAARAARGRGRSRRSPGYEGSLSPRTSRRSRRSPATSSAVSATPSLKFRAHATQDGLQGQAAERRRAGRPADRRPAAAGEQDRVHAG
jgi:hypothetical protein